MNYRTLCCGMLLVGLTSAAACAEVPKVVQTVDQQLQAAWKEHTFTPAPEVDDARFLRRVSLDLTGRLPEPSAVTEFLNDSSSDKRARAIDKLLDSPAYADHWATYWDNILMGRLTREAFIDRSGFKTWIHDQFEKNTPWDAFVTELVTAEGYNCNRQPKNGVENPKDMVTRFNPATNWFLRYSRSIQDLSSATSKVFLGVQIQCAQCHDHKTEKWTQKDFKQFTAFYAKTWPTYIDKTLTLGTVRMDVKDRIIVPPYDKYEQLFGSYKDYAHESPKLLDGPQPNDWGSRRATLAKWVTAKQNPYFAKAIVNRLWGKMLGRGFVEPIDDFRPGNPPLLPDTLQTLAADFSDHKYDLKHLFRSICNSQAYGRACRESSKNSAAGEPNYWTSYPLKSLEVEELFDAIVQATDARQEIEKLSKGKWDMIRNAFVRQFVNQMGTDDMAEVTEIAETIPRSLMMLNGSLVNGATRMVPGFGLAALLAGKSDDAQCLETLYLRTLSRKPTADELSHWQAFVKQSRSVAHTPGPPSEIKTGAAGLKVSDEIAKATKDDDFGELIKHAKTGADFTAMAGRMKNNADAGLYIKALESFAAEAPFQYLATVGGGNSPRQQAFEDVYWALLNCTEFLTNH